MNELMDLVQKILEEMRIIKRELTLINSDTIEKIKSEWVDSQDVMMCLHISKRTLQNLRDNKTIPFSKINGKFYYKTADLKALLDSNYTHNSRSHE
jgi:hypothetical protein